MAQKPLKLTPHLPEAELKARYEASSDVREARRWHALWLIAQGYSTTRVGEVLGLSGFAVRRILTRYNSKGPDGVRDGRRSNPGRSPRLDAEQTARLLEALKGAPPQGGLWSGPKVAAWIEQQTGLKTPKQLGWTYLKRVGARLRVPRRKHAKAASKDEQEAWERALAQRVERIRAEAAEQGRTIEVEVWAQDEARLGLKPILRRVWTLPGARPVAVSWHRYEWLYVYAFVHPSSGRTEWFILPTVSSEVMSLALEEFAHAVGAGPTKTIVLVLDGAGWHEANDLVVPEGIELVVLPAYTPELQPAERLWPLVHEQIANTAIQTLDELEDRLVARCRQLIEQRELISGLTNFHWWPKAA
jgi:transposase